MYVLCDDVALGGAGGIVGDNEEEFVLLGHDERSAVSRKPVRIDCRLVTCK